jgi:hypothetical protein
MTIPNSKRKWDESDCFSSEDTVSDVDTDIAFALTGKNANEESDDDLNKLVHESIVKRNVKGGTEVLKRTKGKTKIIKGEVGGGSFQSMGTCFSISTSRYTLTLSNVVRSSPITIAFIDFARISNTDSDPTPCHSCSLGKPSSRSRGDGSHRLRKVFGVYDPPCPAAGRYPLYYIWSQSIDIAANSRTCIAITQSREGVITRLAFRP